MDAVDATRTLLERYEKIRSARATERKPAQTDDRPGVYRRAAAVLHRFVIETLQPPGGRRPDESPRIILFHDIERVTSDTGEALFVLKNEVRLRALRELRTRAAMLEMLEANPERIMTPLQQTWEEYLRTGKLPELAPLRFSELTNVCQVAGWMEGLDDSLPSSETLLEWTRQKGVFASFEHLVDSRFTGREKELERLRKYIGAILPGSSGDGVQRQLKKWKGLKKAPILTVDGPGGIGKTALIGRLLLDHVQAEPEARIPFAYLAFDQPQLRIETPFTLLVEAAAQFELQWPQHQDAIETFRRVVREIRVTRDDLGERRKVLSSRAARIDEVQSLDSLLYDAFAKLLQQLGARTLNGRTISVPVLLVLDTFEEVQYRDRESLIGLWRMVGRIQAAYPPFRVLISGRGPVEDAHIAIERFTLAELSEKDSKTLLRRLGLTDDTIVDAVAQQIGGNPLSLRLAANLVRSSPSSVGAAGISDLSTKKWLVFRVGEELIQGQLYQRILAHIHDENVAKLAHPGMVLRRVTPEVILSVLGPACLQSILELPEEKRLAEAKRLFGELKRENALVQMDLEGALVYRPEIRRAMVRLLEQDRFADVRELRRAAIAFYERQESVEARAEEIYHRLILGEDDFEDLDRRWMAGIEQSIAASLEEYPPRAQAWLASRMDLEVDRDVLLIADIAEWERNVVRKVQRALSYRDEKGALHLLRERNERTPASPLFALEAKAHMLRRDYESAAQVLERGIARVAESTNRGRLAELFWLQSQVALLRKPESASLADEMLSRAEECVEGASNPLPLIHILSHRLLLRQTYRDASYAETPAVIRLRLDRACPRLDDSDAYSAEFVVRLAVEMLGDEYPRTRDRLRDLVQGPGLESASSWADANALTSENLQGLDEYREAWEAGSQPTPEALA